MTTMDRFIIENFHPKPDIDTIYNVWVWIKASSFAQYSHKDIVEFLKTVTIITQEQKEELILRYF